MNRIKQKARIKEPVRLRVKNLVNGNQSLYLDTYCKGKRKYDEFTRESHRRIWLHDAENGGVLVSPFISGAEKDIRAQADARNGRFIILTAEPFTDKYKPTGHNFELCASGRLLLVSAAKILGSKGDCLTRGQCLALNELAMSICMCRPCLLRRFIGVSSGLSDLFVNFAV